MISFNGPLSNIEFEMTFSGVADMQTPIVSLAVFWDDVKLSFPAVKKEGSTYQVNFDAGDAWECVKTGEYDCQFEVVIGDRVFVPLKDTFKFGQGEAVPLPPEIPAVEPTVPEEPKVDLEKVEVIAVEAEPVQEPKPVYVPMIIKPTPKPTVPGSLFKSFETKPSSEDKPKVKIVDFTIPEAKLVNMKKTSTIVEKQEINIVEDIVKATETTVVQKTKPKLTKKEVI